eukprot:c18662_g1_i1 orf=62-1495(+)
MPELPEVEAARRAVHESCCGRRILQASVADDNNVIDGVTPSALESALVGRTVLAVHRKGKNLWLELDARPWPSFQFGMTGAFYIKGKEITKYKRSVVSDKEEWPSKFSKVFLKLDDGLEVSFTDKRRLARVRLIDDPVVAPPISQLGPDAFLELPVEATFMSSILKKRCPIKALLLDQSFLAGIGNWVADEVLYQARIHPEQVASSLSEAECMELHKTIQEVLKLSVDVDADSEQFPKDWIFHYRWNKKPGEVGGQKISFITVGGRTSAIVPALQKCTVNSSRKQKGSTEEQVEDKDLENGTSDSKKKRGRNEQPVKVVTATKAEDADTDQIRKRSKRPTKQSSPGNKAGSKQGGKGKKIETNLEGEESKPGVSNDKRPVRSSKTRTQKVDEVAALPKSGSKQGKAPAKKQEKTREEAATITEAVAHNEKEGNKASARKRSKNSKDSIQQESPKVDKAEVSNIPKKIQGQKRKRVPK